MAAFGISFPKLTLCRPTTPKADTNTVSATATTTTTTTTATIIPTINTRTLSLSIKNVPSQPIHYDVSTTTIKKTSSPITTILAIDGETKQLPKNLSVFNELRLDNEITDNKEKRSNSTDIIIPSSLSPIGPTDCRSDIEFHIDRDLKKILYDRKDDDKLSSKEHRSNHTFTPPTSSLSHNSSSCDLHLTSSSISADLPQLKYAIERFLVDDDNPIYQVAEEFSSGFLISHQDQNVNTNSMEMTKPDVKDQKYDKIVDVEFHPTNEKKFCESSTMSNNTKWYVSELRIHRPFIYQTPWIDEQQYTHNRRISHSVSNLNQIYDIFNRKQTHKIRQSNDIIFSSLSLQNVLDSSEQQHHHQLNENNLFNNHLSSTNDDLCHIYSDEDEPQLSPLTVRRIVNQHSTKDDTLIRNESVKKKLFDILNDDELENACLEDMSQEFDKMSLNHHPIAPHRDLPILNSFSSSSDDALYYSPPNEPSASPPLLPVLCLPFSTSYNENLSLHHSNTTERYFGRSRLITTSLDKIPMNDNCSAHSSSSCLVPSTDEQLRPSWSTSPSPHWRMDEQSLPMTTILKRYSSMDVDRVNDTEDSNRFLSRNNFEFNVKENKYIHTYNHGKEQKHVSYSLMNTSAPLVDSPSTILPIIHDKPSNLIMFI